MLFFDIKKINNHATRCEFSILQIRTKFQSCQTLICSHFVPKTRKTVDSINSLNHTFFYVSYCFIFNYLLFISHLLNGISLKVIEKRNKPLWMLSCCFNRIRIRKFNNMKLRKKVLGYVSLFVVIIINLELDRNY